MPKSKTRMTSQRAETQEPKTRRQWHRLGGGAAAQWQDGPSGGDGANFGSGWDGAEWAESGRLVRTRESNGRAVGFVLV